MPPLNYILNGFSLGVIRPRVYRNNIGPGLGQPELEYEEQDVEVVQSLSIESDDKPQISALGTPIFSDLQIVNPETNTGVYFETVLFDVSMEKIIVKTQIVGRNGTVKEYIADGDYQINIKGAMVNPQKGAYPIDQVTEFINLMKAPNELEVISDLMQLFEIDLLVVDAYNLPQKAGFQNMQLFEITASSDKPIEFLDDAEIN